MIAFQPHYKICSFFLDIYMAREYTHHTGEKWPVQPTSAAFYWQFTLLLGEHEHYLSELLTKYASDSKIPASGWCCDMKGTKKVPLHPYINHAVVCIANPPECCISDRALTLNGCARLHKRNADTLLSLKARVLLRWQNCSLKLLFLHSDDDCAVLSMMDDSEICAIERHRENELLCPFKIHAVKREF